MLFSTGMGIGMVFWGTAEPLSHYISENLATGHGAPVEEIKYMIPSGQEENKPG